MKNVNLIYLIDFTFWDLVHIMVGKRCGICIVPHNIFSSIRCVMHAFLLARLSPRLSFFLPVWSWLSCRSSIFPFRLLSLVIKNILKPNWYWLKWPVCMPWWKPPTKFPGNVPPATSWCWASQMNWKTTGENYRHSGRWWMRKSMKPSSHYRKMALIQSHCNWVRI